VSLVMGLDQHRAQISAELIDRFTGEVSRARVAPADRDGVRTFLGRFADQDLEVALEATTGWRFVVEELQRIGADVHLAEPAETSALKGKKQRAKTDWADARHQRELLLIGRLPESWIPPAHLLDLRARVRCRHTLSEQRTEWQQRMQAVLYHHGVPQRRDLLTLEKRAWMAGLTPPAAAREQIDISLQIIDALDLQLVPLDLDLRAYARKQPGCGALVDQIYGVGGLIVKHQAATDPVTGLANHRTFHERLSSEGRTRRSTRARAEPRVVRFRPFQADQRHPRPPNGRQRVGCRRAAPCRGRANR
jgi:transposase